jgi:alpha-glucosidase
VARLLRAAVVGARPDAVVLAEHAHDASGDLDRDGWQGTMNYPGFTRPVWSWLRGPDLDLDNFLGVPGGVPSRGAADAVATMTAFNGLVSWRSYTHSWTLLGSHDTARIRTVVGGTGPAAAGRHEVALGLLMTLPGVPMIFAGDEFGLTGDNGEASRTPMPWGSAVTPCYPALVRLRRDHEPLRTGGLRWLHADGDALAFVRESSTGSLLVYARRASGPPLSLPLTGASNVYGGAASPPGDGPTFQVWRLP